MQARTSSTRLPGKVLRPLLGAPMLARQVERLRRAARIDRLVIATSGDASDDGVAELGAALGLAVHRGPLDDVLARFAGALIAHPARRVLRLTGDCPLADPQVIDRLIERHEQSGADYSSNTAPERTFPQGLDAEIMRAEVLRAAAAEAESAYDHEHVTPFIYARPERFRLAFLSSGEGPTLARWTVDTPEDFGFVEQVYEGLYPADPAFTSEAVRGLVERRPDLRDFGGSPRAWER